MASAHGGASAVCARNREEVQAIEAAGFTVVEVSESALCSRRAHTPTHSWRTISRSHSLFDYDTHSLVSFRSLSPSRFPVTLALFMQDLRWVYPDTIDGSNAVNAAVLALAHGDAAANFSRACVSAHRVLMLAKSCLQGGGHNACGRVCVCVRARARVCVCVCVWCVVCV
jgi:hypothetical protein